MCLIPNSLGRIHWRKVLNHNESHKKSSISNLSRNEVDAARFDNRAESQLSGRPGEAPAYAGTDFIIARDGRIAALYLFFDKLP